MELIYETKRAHRIVDARPERRGVVQVTATFRALWDNQEGVLVFERLWGAEDDSEGHALPDQEMTAQRIGHKHMAVREAVIAGDTWLAKFSLACERIGRQRDLAELPERVLSAAEQAQAAGHAASAVNGGRP